MSAACVGYALRSDPYPPTAEPLLRELKGYWKLKVNGYRVIYRVNDDDKVIFVRVRKRNRNTYLSQ